MVPVPGTAVNRSSQRWVEFQDWLRLSNQTTVIVVLRCIAFGLVSAVASLDGEVPQLHGCCYGLALAGELSFETEMFLSTVIKKTAGRLSISIIYI